MRTLAFVLLYISLSCTCFLSSSYACQGLIKSLLPSFNMKSSHEKISDTISAQTINAWIVAKTYCHTVSLG